METVARVAGIAEGSDHGTEVSRDVEASAGAPWRRRSASQSRVSLPDVHLRNRSQSTVGRGAYNAHGKERPISGYSARRVGASGNESDEREEPLWGPSHPCFPHLNPHVPLSSPLYESTRIIRVPRDYMVAGDLAPAFSNIYPEILEPVLSERHFRELVTHVNAELRRAFDPRRPRAVTDAVLGFLTGWLWEDAGLTDVKRTLRRLDDWIEQWNTRVAEPLAVRVIPLRRTAYLSIDIQIPDPQITPDGPDFSIYTANETDVNGSVRPSASIRRYAPDDSDNTPVPPIPDKYLDEATGAANRGRGLDKPAKEEDTRFDKENAIELPSTRDPQSSTSEVGNDRLVSEGKAYD